MLKAEEKPVSEYGEPWHIDPDKLYLNSLCQSNGNYVAIDAGGARDAERIVACVNALSGIPNPEAVRELVEACQSAAENGAMCEWVRPFVAALGEVPAVRHDAIRELIEAATELRQKFNHVALTRLYAAVESLSAPSTGAQQK